MLCLPLRLLCGGARVNYSQASAREIQCHMITCSRDPVTKPYLFRIAETLDGKSWLKLHTCIKEQMPLSSTLNLSLSCLVKADSTNYVFLIKRMAKFEAGVPFGIRYTQITGR